MVSMRPDKRQIIALGLVIVLAAFFVRLIAAWLAPHPGIADSNHYYNLARNVAAGRGFVIDYIWQYHNPPVDVTHPIDYWMPLPAIWPAVGLRLVPDSLFAALLPSVVLGVLVVTMAYVIARVLRVDAMVGVLAAAFLAFMPQLVLNSARTDTTMSYVFFVGIACISFYAGLRRHPFWLLLAGVAAGLAQLSRQDAIILVPAMLLALILHWRFRGEERLPWRWLWLIPVGWLGIMAPWFIRNYALYEVLLPSGASRTLFMTSFNDQFTYGRTLDLDHYLEWGIGNILSNLLTMVLANIKTIYTTLDLFLPVAAAFGLILMLIRRERELLLMLALPATLLLGLFSFYSFVTPFHTMGGSFFKSYQYILPFAAFVGAWGLWQIVRPQWAAILLVALASGFMLLNSFDTVRLDFGVAGPYDQAMAELAEVLTERGDQNGDGRITVMAQDPYMLNYHGFYALMLPSDPLEMILEAAYRYDVDYLLLPSARAALEPFENGEASDPRLQLVPATDTFRLLLLQPSGS